MKAVELLVVFAGLISFTQGLILDEGGLYEVKWAVDVITKTVTFQATVQTTGYVGLGLSPTASMWEADITISGVDKNGQGFLNDYYGVGETRPQLDESQDYTLLDASQNGTHTNVMFSRLIVTGDERDVQIEAENGTNFIWSFGQTDDLYYHGPNRGSRPINLFVDDGGLRL